MFKSLPELPTILPVFSWCEQYHRKNNIINGGVRVFFMLVNYHLPETTVCRILDQWDKCNYKRFCDNSCAASVAQQTQPAVKNDTIESCFKKFLLYIKKLNLLCMHC